MRGREQLGHYFFHLRYDGGLPIDEEGRRYATLDDVIAASFLDARSIMAEDVKKGELNLDQCLDVSDTNSVLVHRLDFVDAITVHYGSGSVHDGTCTNI
jgi:hypothetical protein